MKRVHLRALIGRGIDQIREHPQLWLTIIVAIAIIGSFAYVADRFIGIAQDAQERLVNVRVGALQDAFVPLAAAYLSDPVTLERNMTRLMSLNPTIVEFEILQAQNGVWIVTASPNHDLLGRQLQREAFITSLAQSDPNNSFTKEEVEGKERYFRTARAITNDAGEVVAIALTRQSLSEADRSIASSIRTSVIIFSVILILLLILFFHHARIIDYSVLYRKLQEVDALKDDLISMVSHEFRTPLTVIKGYVQELKGKEDPVGREDMVLKIERSTEMLNLLVADMLEVARIEQGRTNLQIHPIDPKPIVDEIISSLKSIAEKKGIIVRSELSDGHSIMVDSGRLQQVLVNLVNNAIKYSDKGEVVVRAEKDGRMLALRVSDSGIGMSAEEQAQLFQKFHRAAGERVRREVGTGLGLWITKQLVEAMSGRIAVESIKGVGSHFIVSFPLAAR